MVENEKVCRPGRPYCCTLHGTSCCGAAVGHRRRLRLPVESAWHPQHPNLERGCSGSRDTWRSPLPGHRSARGSLMRSRGPCKREPCRRFAARRSRRHGGSHCHPARWPRPRRRAARQGTPARGQPTVRCPWASRSTRRMSTGPVTWLGLGLGLGLGCEGEGTRQDSFGMLFTNASRARLLAPLRS